MAGKMKSKGSQSEAASNEQGAERQGWPAKLLQAGLLALVALLLGGAWVWFSQPSAKQDGPATSETSRRIKGNLGPWGELEYIPILIETPDEFLSVAGQGGREETVWFFQNLSVTAMAEIFNAAGLSRVERDWLLDQRNWMPVTNGFAISPPPHILMGISPEARQRIYSVLADCGGNPLHELPMAFRRDALDMWFYSSGLSANAVALTKSLLYQRGNAWCLSDWPLLLRSLQSPDEQRRLLKTLSRQSTLLVRLRVGQNSDLDPLVSYWGRSGRLKDIRPLLQSVAMVPEGVHLDVVHLLPRFVRSRIYTYPFPSEPGGAIPGNCFWSSMNFFSSGNPDDRYNDPEEMRRCLREDYFPIADSYLLGDVILLSKPDGTLVHAVVFIADDVVFTKNGAASTQPWMFTRMQDLAASYPSEQPLKLKAYRRRDM